MTTVGYGDLTPVTSAGRAVASIAAVLGLQFGYYPPVIVGMWSGVAGGIDLSLVVSIVTAAVLYVLALLIWPEPEYVYGPKGPRIGRGAKGEVPPVR